jgi:DNA polymerase-3 subunit gamma/tau
MALLALKYRPRRWDDLTGQQHVTKVLRLLVASNKVPPSLIFSGSRGTGKTTTARILAAAVNCTGVAKPCGKCPSCQQMLAWQSPDFIELDGASSGSVADMREVRQQALFAPIGKCRVYVVDECHSLSKEAWNALLKLLEEPPPTVLFIFATTEPERVPVTISSRSLSFIFRRLTVPDIVSRLQFVCEQEQLVVKPEAMERIAVAVDGGMRDALMIMEQALAVSDTVELDTVNEVLGLADEGFLFEVVQGLVTGDIELVEARMKQLFVRGASLDFFVRDLQAIFSELLRAQLGVDAELLDVSSARKDVLEKMRLAVDMADVRRIIEQLWKLQDRVAVSAAGAHMALLTGLLLMTKATPKKGVWTQPLVPTRLVTPDELLAMFK